MPAPTVIYSAGRERFRADTCAPVAAAVHAGAIAYAFVVHGAYPGLKLPGNVLPEVRNAGCWNIPSQQAWGLDWHRNEGIEFTFLASGQLDFAVDDRSFALRPGDLTITRPWQRHRLGHPHVGTSRLVWLILDVGIRRPHQRWTWPAWLVLSREERNRLTTLLRQNEQPVWRADAHVADSFSRIAGITEIAVHGLDRTRLVLAINELLKAIIEMLDGRNIPLDETLTSSARTVELFLGELGQHVGEQ